MTQDSPWWVALFSDNIILAALVAMWGLPVFALIQLAKGQAWIEVAVLIGWFPAFWWVACCRFQRHRVSCVNETGSSPDSGRSWTSGLGRILTLDPCNDN